MLVNNYFRYALHLTGKSLAAQVPDAMYDALPYGVIVSNWRQKKGIVPRILRQNAQMPIPQSPGKLIVVAPHEKVGKGIL